MECTKCGSKTINVVGATDRSVLIECDTCGRRVKLEKLIIGHKDNSVYKQSCMMRKGESFLIEARGALISKATIVAGDMIDLGFKFGGAILEYVSGTTDMKKVGVIRILLK